MTDEPRLTEAEFCARFRARMLEFAEKFENGDSVAEYADAIAPSYYYGQYSEPDNTETPEDWADADIECWSD